MGFALAPLPNLFLAPAVGAAHSGTVTGKKGQEETQVAQVSSVAPWRAWAAKEWPVGIVIIVALLAAIWMWRGKEAKSDAPIAASAAAPANPSSTVQSVATPAVSVHGNAPQHGSQKA